MTDKTREYVASLTGLRGIAALFVFLFHYGSLNPGIRLDQSVPVIGYALQFPLGFGFTGVDMFFVLSGFLLSLPFAHATLTRSTGQPLGKYYKDGFCVFSQLSMPNWPSSWYSVHGSSRGSPSMECPCWLT